jgi:hypothetical protein
MKADYRTPKDRACYYGHGTRQRFIGTLYVGRDGFLRYKPKAKT